MFCLESHFLLPVLSLEAMPELLGAPIETCAVWLVIGINVCCLAVYYTALCHAGLVSLSGKAGCSGFPRAILPALKGFLGGSKQYLLMNKAPGTLERKARRLAAAARLRRGLSLCRIGTHVVATLTAFTLLSFRYYDLSQFRDTYRARWELHQSNFVNMTLCFIMGLYGWLVPNWTTVRTLDFGHFLVFARLCWQVCTSVSVYHLFALETVSVGMRFLGALIVGTPRFTLGLNAMYSFAKMWTFATLFGVLSEEEQGFVALVWGSLPVLISHEIFLCASTWCVSAIVESWNYAAVQANLQAAASSTGEDSVKSILVVMCDAVVHVDKDLLLTSPSMELASFLLRRPLTRTYEGGSLLQFVEEQDRDRIREQMTTSLIGHGTTLSLSTKLIDCNDSAIAVQMYCTCFIDVNDSRAYVIGILEVKESLFQPERADDMSVGEDATDWLHSVRGSGSLRSAASEHTDDAFGSTGSAASVTLPLVMDNRNAELWVDLNDGKLSILDASTPMRAMTGPIGFGTDSLLDWLPGYTSSVVIARIFHAMDVFGKDDTASRADLGDIHLRTPHAALAGLEYKANLTMDMTPLLTADEDDNPHAVCFELHNIGVKKLRQSPKRKRELRRPSGTAPTSVEHSVGEAGTQSALSPCVSL
eukprot:TRINITY_DN5949_c0_g1_i1.p1 TRINITY_DN5949_c0_g1~~TRINITY_DN5949_c0_g1_i1.p1  ORF type:complete len:646 (-),score=74.01 TRINITY_DN5949_c0_g1_i1:126-2063(-)